jgi:[ribosomal protein S5]-alanine N-acetyltransferase
MAVYVVVDRIFSSTTRYISTIGFDISRGVSMRVPVIETERLLIRPFRVEDLPAIHQILDIELDMETQPIEEREQWLRWSIMNYDELAKLYQPPYGDRAVVLKESDLLIGASGLVSCLMPFELLPSYGGYAERPELARFTAEVGLYYALSPRHWGRGYATEAARALVEHCFSTLRLKRVVATTAHDNAGSIGVMKRLGMRIERNPHPEPEWFQVVGTLESQ